MPRRHRAGREQPVDREEESQGCAAGVVGYAVMSLFGVLMSRPDGAAPHWLVQAVLGPLWHLSAFLAVCRRPFQYLDGVVRVQGSDARMAVMSLCIWSTGLVLICVGWRKRHSRTSTAARWLLVTLWFAVAFLNVYLFALFTL